MSRIEATVADTRIEILTQLAEELGANRSQIVDEAIGLFIKSVLEIKKGNVIAIFDRDRKNMICELSTPTITALEWRNAQKITQKDMLEHTDTTIADPALIHAETVVSPESLEKIEALVNETVDTQSPQFLEASRNYKKSTARWKKQTAR